MSVNSPGPIERASRLWRLEGVPADGASDGPLALLLSAVALAWQYKIRLIACTLAGMILAGLYAQSLPRIYNASATLLLEPRQAGFGGHEIGTQPSLDLNSAESELQIIRSERLLSAVFDSLGLYDDAELAPQPAGTIAAILSPVRDFFRQLMGDDLAAPAKTKRSSSDMPDGTAATAGDNARRIAFGNFVKHVGARRVGQSYVVEIEYWSSNPQRPAKVANAIVSGYILQSVAFKEETARAGTETLQGRLNALAVQVDAARAAMTSGQLPAIATPDADARIIGAALPPLSPSSPRSSLITALGGLLGLMCGASATALGVVLNRQVRDPRQLAEDTGIACLTSVPDIGEKAALTWRMDNSGVKQYAAAIKDLRTSIEIACAAQRRERNLIIALVGTTHNAGASVLCRSLAQLLTRSGRDVTLFRSQLDTHSNFLSRPPMSLADAAVSNLNFVLPPPEDTDGIAILPIHSRELSTNIYADFRHPRVLRILDAARSRGDVVIELPDFDSSRDALALGFHADAVIIVAKAGGTSIDEVKEAYQQLRRAGANVIGTLINKVKP